VGWYLAEHDQQRLFRAKFNAIEDARQQLDALSLYFDKFAGESALSSVTEQVSPAA
jgi:tRNA-dihydrouridine synthase B